MTIQKRVTIWPVGTSMRLRTIKDEGTVFRTVPPDSLQALALVNGAIEGKLGTATGKLASVVYRNEPYGEGLAKDFSAAWTAKGGKVQGPVVFDPAQATFDSEAGQVVANNPDVYIIIDYPDTYAKLGAALGPHRQVRSDEGLRRAGRARRFRRCPATFRPKPSRTCGARAEGRTPTGTDAYKVFCELVVAEGRRCRAFFSRRQQFQFYDIMLPGGRRRRII